MKEPLYVQPGAKCEHILKLFRKGHNHMAIVVADPESLVAEAEAVVNHICQEGPGNVQLLSTQEILSREPLKHDVLGIITMENLLESILNLKILDEKDVDKLRRKAVDKGDDLDFQDPSRSEAGSKYQTSVQDAYTEHSYT